ncbi:MAG TPA: hypothetical protein ENI61_06320 [Ignavibacteria bacterium]|nr:hypothetical protein [Ignavibacteria bacterium]
MEEIKTQEPTLNEKIDEIYSTLKNGKNKIKKLRLPRKARVKGKKMKKGYAGVLFINENRTISGEKVKLDGGTYQTKDNNYHVTNGNELFFWEGKYPILWQRYDKLNPTNILAKEGHINEVYGQDMIKLKMKKDIIKDKKKGGGISWLYIALLVGGGYFLIKAFFPSLIGG